MTVRHVRVGRTARIESVGDPRRARQTWYLLHGYGQTPSDVLSATECLRRDDRAFVAPEGLSRFYVRHRERSIGASWMTSRDRDEEIADTVDYLRSVPAVVGADRVLGATTVLLGFSQGAAAAARWVALGGLRPSRLVLWGGEVPPDLPVDAFRGGRSGFELVLVRGKADEAYPHASLVRDLERLGAAGVAARALEFDGGHELDRGPLIECARALEAGENKGGNG